MVVCFTSQATLTQLTKSCLKTFFRTNAGKIHSTAGEFPRQIRALENQRFGWKTETDEIGTEGKPLFANSQNGGHLKMFCSNVS